jgi:hypothetical protein
VFDYDGTVTYDGSVVTEGWQNWDPIGYEKPNSYSYYSGTFNGNGCTVSGVYFNDDGRYAVGFFGFIDNASINGLYITNAYISGYSTVGGIVGYSRSSNISDCSYIGSVHTLNNFAGGIVGYIAESSIYSCANNGDVSGFNSYIGGVVGLSNGSTLDNCINNGSVRGYMYVGGIAGSNTLYGDINSCTNRGDISVNYGYGGGIVGYNVCSGSVYACDNSGYVWGDYLVGAVVGWNYEGSISNSIYYVHSSARGIGYCTNHYEHNCTSCGVSEYY